MSQAKANKNTLQNILPVCSFRMTQEAIEYIPPPKIR